MIDKVTYFVYMLNNPILDFISIMTNSQAFLVIAIASLIVLFERKERDFARISKILFIIFLAYILTEGLKNVFAVQRPCISEIESKIPCPSDFSFPSGHVLIAGSVMFAYIKRKGFIIFWLFTILVAFSRVYLGVHTLVDVAGSIALAPLIFHFSNILWGWVFGKAG
ncbi:MAG: phosphatase PAP2 family protein [Candidatus Anstonellales archaeon]